LFVATALSVSIALMLAFWGLGLLFASHVERRAIDDLSVQLDQILAGVERDEKGKIRIGSAPADARFSKPFGGLYWQIEVEGLQLRSRSLWDFALDLPPDHLKSGTVHVHYLSGPGENQLLVMERSIVLSTRLGGVPMRAAVAMDASQLEKSNEEFREDLVPFTLLLALFIVFAGAVQVIVGLRPLNSVERRISRIRTGDVNRVGEDFPTEIRPLAAEVDALLLQREKDIEQARHRAGDLAHGLKTPLQALLGDARRVREAGLTDTAASIESTVKSMHRHVERELNRVRIATRAATSKADLTEAASRVIAVVQKASLNDALKWDLDAPANLVVAADMEDLSAILGAITENASRHARRQVRISARKQATHAVLSVLDDGPGIPPDKIDTLMRRGVREDETGTGLGLAIARELSEALGGSLELISRDPGLMVRITLPLAAT
jgi:signal transduction histidine kinase